MIVHKFCEGCLFFAKYGDRDRGECRRYPPQTMRSSLGETISDFPRVSDYHWCGEWKEKS